MDKIFQDLVDIIQDNVVKMKLLADRIEQLESIGGGGGSASIEDYESGKEYKRNVLIVDTTTETVYRVLSDYTSTTVEDDKKNGLIKLVGFESQLVSFNHDPSQTEINTLPMDTVVTIYSSTDDPYEPILSGD